MTWEERKSLDEVGLAGEILRNQETHLAEPSAKPVYHFSPPLSTDKGQWYNNAQRSGSRERYFAHIH